MSLYQFFVFSIEPTKKLLLSAVAVAVAVAHEGVKNDRKMQEKIAFYSFKPVFIVTTSSNLPYVACLCKITINSMQINYLLIKVTLQISYFTL